MAYAGPENASQAFTHPGTHPLVLNLLLLREFGHEYLGWEPETIWSEVSSVWGRSISDVSKQKVQAVRACYVSSLPLQQWPAFEKVAAGLVGVAPRPDDIQRPSPGRAHMALDVLAHVQDNGKPGDEVARYCAAVLLDHGMVYGPGSLEIANPFVRSDPALQAQVRSAMGRAASISGNTALDVQVSKSRAVASFASGMADSLAEQVRRVAS